MIKSLVVAAATNNAIGKDNQLLWHLPNDLKFLKNKTWAMPVLMGRKSFESLGKKPLKGRVNIVLSTSKYFKHDGIVHVSNLKNAYFFAAENDYKEIMILGGAHVYEQTINEADNIYITRVHHVFEDADAFFPVIDESKWKLVFNEDHYKDEKHAYDYSFQHWVKK
ncbi:dihydrofolate reductase [Parafilimonas sp.]|jgi:dihydrofolate reductase|uniref:dihydrofolate reductase n=1 Tax=Parafilimonas sp. TaxID=1969739 RepID=UPI003F7D772C